MGSCAIEKQEKSKMNDFQKKCIGFVLLLCVNFLWVLASILVQYIFHNMEFNAPFLLTYISNSLFFLFLPVTLITHQKAKKEGKESPLRKTIKAALFVAPVWFFAQGMYNGSLDRTTVAASTVISSSSSAQTYILSILLLKEKSSWKKIVGVILCLGGVCLTSFSDSKDGDSTAIGDIMAFLSATGYACYTTQIKKYVTDDVPMSGFFGFLGVFGFIFFLPVMIIIHVFGWEDWSGLTWTIFGLLIVKGLGDNVLSDYLWGKAIQFTSPTIATIGLSFTIPLSMLSDLVLHGDFPTAFTGFGAIFILFGFIMVNLGTKTTKEDLKNEEDGIPSLPGTPEEQSLKEPLLSDPSSTN
eukprot:TRINITY_DN524579_c0_g1_i1.p1 TRINITY_DN524579_c0_g1~~TRINITY_DN524579_c0_g1_i1.p1  ORF type:complete len:355 (-),score=72.63 TRINITY_DN524579_c0_g1_i1:173-1237(-)